MESIREIGKSSTKILCVLFGLLVSILVIGLLLPTDVTYPETIVNTLLEHWAQQLNNRFSLFPSSLVFLLQRQIFLGTIGYLPHLGSLLLLDSLALWNRKKLSFPFFVLLVMHPLLFLEIGWNISHYRFDALLIAPYLLLAILARYLWIKKNTWEGVLLSCIAMALLFFSCWVIPLETVVYTTWSLFLIPLLFFEWLPYFFAALFACLFFRPLITKRISLKLLCLVCLLGYILLLVVFPTVTVINGQRWYGSWIWSSTTSNDQYLRFNKTFVWSPRVPAHVSLDITAKSAYRLYVNDQWVGDGPGPIDDKRRVYDHYNLSRYLQTGKNTLNIIAYNYGHDTHFQKKQLGGLLAQLDFRMGLIHLFVATDKTWQVSDQAGWQRIDLSKANVKEEEINSGIYREDYAVPDSPIFRQSTPYPIISQDHLVRRDIPALDHQQLLPVTVTEEEGHQWFDFAAVIAGYPLFTFTPHGATAAHILYVEEKKGSVVQTDTVRFSHDAPVSYRVFGRRGMRFIDVSWENGTGNVSVVVDAVHIPAQKIGSFSSSDPSLDAIYHLGENTLTYAMQDQFEDSFIHERSQYLADSYVDMLSGFYSRDPTVLAKKALYQYASTQRSDGLIETVYPSSLNQTILSFNLLYIQFLRDYFFYTNDRQTLTELFPVAEKITAAFDRITDDLGWVDISQAHSLQVGRVLTDWINHTNPPQRSPDVDLSLTALRYRAVDTLASLSSFADPKDRKLWEEKKKALGEKLRIALKSQSLSGIEPHAAVLLINSGVLEKKESDQLYQTVLAHPKDPFVTGYFNLFYLQAIYRQHDAAGIVALLDGYWGSMIRQGALTTWETYDPRDGMISVSRTHAWASGPTYFLPAYVAGVRPLTPGYGSILVQPLLITDTAAVHLTVSCGTIDEQWSKSPVAFTLELTTSCPSDVVFRLPFQKAAVSTVSLNGKMINPVFDADSMTITSRERKTVISLTIGG